MKLVDAFADYSRFVKIRRDIHAHPELGSMSIGLQRSSRTCLKSGASKCIAASQARVLWGC